MHATKLASMRTVPLATCVLSIAAALTSRAFAGTILFVDDDAPPAGDGTGWASAFRFLQDALAVAAEPDADVGEIRVAQGLYRPDRSEAAPAGTGDRLARFQLVNGVGLLGGYAGLGAADPDARDVDRFPTVLSGDLLGDDGPESANNGENSYHVVGGTGTDDTAVVDGLTITAGNAESPVLLGGAIIASPGAPRVVDCRITRNHAVLGGAVAVVALERAQMTFIDCVFTANEAEGDGGAIYSTDAGTILESCVFTGNHADYDGGAIYTSEGDVTLAGCVFGGNTSGASAGALYHGDGSLVASGCDFTNNMAGVLNHLVQTDGGAVFNDSGNAMLTDCSFVSNTADWATGHGPAHGGGVYNGSGALSLERCELAANSALDAGGGLFNDAGEVTVAGTVFVENEVTAPPLNCMNVPPLGGGGLCQLGPGQIEVSNSFFGGNTTCGDGGAIKNASSGAVHLANCTIVENAADYVGGGICAADIGPVDAEGCVIHLNQASSGPQLATLDSAEVTVSYCNVEGGAEGPGIIDLDGNIDEPPLFVDPDGPDDDPTTWGDNDYRLGAASPSIDAGDNLALPEGTTTDLDGNPRFVDDPDTPDSGNPDGVNPIVDMGAWEFQGSGCAADVTGDGIVGVQDLVEVILSWGRAGGPADVTGDGTVDVQDLVAVVTAWGPCP